MFCLIGKIKTFNLKKNSSTVDRVYIIKKEDKNLHQLTRHINQELMQYVQKEC